MVRGDQDGPGHGLDRVPKSGIVSLVRNADPIALVGVFVSCGLSVALDLTGAASGVESLLAGLMGTTLSLVLDASARAERRYRLRQALEAADWLPGLVTRTAAATADIVRRYPGSALEAEAQRQIRAAAEELEELGRGRMIRPRHDYEQLMAGIEGCRETVDAVTNTISEPHWWTSYWARRYWAANEAALSRGVRIRRVFVYDLLTPDLTALVEEQRLAGVQVALVQSGAVDAALHLNYAVWDERSAWQGQMNAQAELVGNVCIFNRHEVDRLSRGFRQCWAVADRRPGPPGA
ncbi:hypothetical protein [Actinomadura sp. DC4]|uniref:hypothetical protein n=1 Tax=Actinomadura sp. DC4 TaxID=3055069 RepID=UPI0025B07AAA|nr:hypothetical protein [Actinomadura sp. DC4]MDN3356234.1 hypothetical protein [Actinomadura sp. DC4]